MEIIIMAHLYVTKTKVKWEVFGIFTSVSINENLKKKKKSE